MAKKKTVKKTATNVPVKPEKSVIEKRVDRLEACASQDLSAIEALYARIDRIVEAHEKCKSLKNL